MRSPGESTQEAEHGWGPQRRFPESPAAKQSGELGAEEEQKLQYSALVATVLFCLGQTTWVVCSTQPSLEVGVQGFHPQTQRAPPELTEPGSGRRPTGLGAEAQWQCPPQQLVLIAR